MRESSLPSQTAFQHAILRHLAAHEEGDLRENVHAAVPDLLGLSEAQRHDRLPNLPHLRYRHRSGWALSQLKSAGYLDQPSRGTWRMTAAGRALLHAHPHGFPIEVERRLAAEARAGRALGREGEAAEAVEGPLPEPGSPEERIDAAIAELEGALAAEVLERIGRAPPAFFERLVLDLLHALGYGARTDDLSPVGRGADGGIDGIIALDRLGFEKVCVQAKRWQHSVGRPEIQSFYGALAGRKAKKGVFITTSSFTREAKAFASEVSDRIVLIDGARLTALMIEYGVGVSHHRTLRLGRVDNDYFEEG